MSDALGIGQPQRVNFAQMLSGRYFIIPDYQRHYAWTTKQCRELFEDCVLTARNPGRERFMSTITTIAPADNSIFKTRTYQENTQLQPLLVVDGQQRLTSILILVSCICRQLLLDDANDGEAREAYANFVSTPLSDGEVLMRVIPQSIPSHPDLMLRFLEKQVLLDKQGAGRNLRDLIPAQSRIREARETFKKGIEELAKESQGERVSLKDLLTCVSTRLIFILNTLSDVGQAGEVFEGLNNRGLGLSALENLKSFSIYAVQSFRRGEHLPTPMTGLASDLIDDLNNAIGSIYHHLDRVALPDDVAKDLLVAYWPIVITRVEQADLGKDEEPPPASLDRALPVDDIRSSLHIQNARAEQQQAKLLDTLRFMICDKLVPASMFFADARRPTHKLSFENNSLRPEARDELRGLHQRLVEMQCSAPFLAIMIAHRATRPDEADDYLALLRLIERVAFWVYGLGKRNKGAGQKDLARLAQKFADGKITFGTLLLSLRSFAITFGKSIDPDQDALDDNRELEDLANDVLDENESSVWAAFAYEWLLQQKVEIPSYSKFLRLVQDEKCLRLVRGGRGQLPSDYDLERSDMDHPGNIVITLQMGNMDAEARKSFNALPYLDKCIALRQIGYSISLPKKALTRAWAKQQRTATRKLFITGSATPENGRILEATWHRDIKQEFYESPEDQDS